MSLMSNILAFPIQPVMPALRRPAPLVRAAVAGQSGFRRSRDLARLMRTEILPAPGRALPWLRAEEDRMNQARIEGAADYDMQRQVLLMIAILAEARAVVIPLATPRLRAVGG